jgi:hypothetical protein
LHDAPEVRWLNNPRLLKTRTTLSIAVSTATSTFYGAMFLLHPTWNAVVMAYRIRVTPDELIGRVQSVGTLALGTKPVVRALLGLMVVAAVAAVARPAIRAARAPA